MPKNKFQDVVFTIIMAAIMVYGMVVYNIALNTGIVDGTTFIAALHELPIMVPVAFILDSWKAGKAAGIYCYEANRQTTVYHICNIYMYMLYHVSCYESCCNNTF